MPKGKAKQVSKMEAMRQAIQKLGPDAENSAIQAALKSDFGVTMTTGMFSNYKSAVMKEMRGKRGRNQAPNLLPSRPPTGRKPTPVGLPSRRSRRSRSWSISSVPPRWNSWPACWRSRRRRDRVAPLVG